MNRQYDRVRELREQLSARLGERAAFSSAVYRDEPILITANQLKQFVPEEIRAARALSKDLKAQPLTLSERFVAQARVLAKCSDEFAKAAEFQCYFPTYDDMDDVQLRTYLTWRTRVRAGDVRETSRSFVYVYMYELINLVDGSDGAGDAHPDETDGPSGAREIEPSDQYAQAESCYRALRLFVEQYERIDSSIRRLAEMWMDDFIIYYGLSPELLMRLPHVKDDQARMALLQYEESDNVQLHAALMRLGGASKRISALARAHEQEFAQVVGRSYRRIAAHAKGQKTTFAQRLLGKKRYVAYQPFDRAVFVDPWRRVDWRYRLTPLDEVFCRNGSWSRVRYSNRVRAREWMRAFLLTVDAELRTIWGEEPAGVASGSGALLDTKYMLKIIREEARSVHEEVRIAEERAVHIDLGKLKGIRTAADATTERLLVDEDAVQNSESADEVECGSDVREPEPSTSPDAPDVGAQEHAGAGENTLLSPDEQAFLRVLLEGSSVSEFERERHVMASLLAESVNEKLFGEFDDIVIDAAGESPLFIEDYRSDVERLFGHDA